jgi:cyclic-di-GMP-binding protein
MPSFDLVSDVDTMEIKNVVAQAQKEVGNRYDFKGSNISVELHDTYIEIKAEDDYKIKTALSILRDKMIKRKMGMKSIEPGDIVPTGNRMFKQVLTLRQGIDKDQGKIINKLVKNAGKKVTSQLMDDKIRLTSKKIDDLQEVFAMLKNHDDVKVDLQMENMKR